MNSTRGSARPVSFFSVVAVFVGFAFFPLMVYFVYLRHQGGNSVQSSAENIPKDQVWKTTAQGRKAYLTELKDKQQHQLATYAWIDQAKGVMQLPIDRAMELTVQEINAQKPTPGGKAASVPSR